MAKTWSAFYNRVAPDLPGCPLPVIDDALREAAIEFCERSTAWRIDHTPINIVANTHTYAFAPGANKVVQDVLWARVNDFPIDPASEESLDADSSIDPTWRGITGDAKYYFRPTETSIRIVYIPAANITGGLTMKVIVKPTPTAEVVDDFLFNEYRNDIAMGAKSRLMVSPGKPYTNAALGVELASQFQIAINAAEVRATKGYTRTPLRTRPVYKVR